MNSLKNSFLIAAAKSANMIEYESTISKKKHVKIKKKPNLKKQLIEAEKIYAKLKKNLSKKDLKRIEEQIANLKQKIEKTCVEFSEEPNHIGIEPPSLDDLEEELNEVSIKPPRLGKKFEAPEIDEQPMSIDKFEKDKEQTTSLLRIPPPPKSF
ncbi:MAG: hypothetical protein ABIC91_02395 [Nanoarchaeota archaeon]|nr:hypothetical protein [Nanoarchaeota archaeon]MBU1030112.1 hypothetical protein [Nanoarchaeota archaeon]MBU1849995.1 hypothetical protein [Nanoarchaeota archaeon]